MRKIKHIMIATLATITLLAGCSGGTASSGDKTLRVAIEKTFTTLNSHASTVLAEMDVIGQFMEGLIGYDESGTLAPLGAESYTKSADGITYTFKLRPDIFWQNGEPVTAHDYVYSWTEFIQHGPSKHNSAMLKNGRAILDGEKPASELGVVANDDYTLTVTLEYPDNAILEYLTSSAFWPMHKETYEANGKNEGYGTSVDTLMTNGPFELTEYIAGSKIVLTKNQNYWNAANIDLDAVEITVVPELTTQKTLFDSGDLDYIRVQGELVDVFNDKTKQVARPENRMLYMYLSGTTKTEDKILANHNFRKAIYHAFDRKLITETILKDGSEPMYGLIPRGFSEVDGTDFRDISGKYNENPYNASEAQSYLEKAKAELGMENINFTFAVQDMVIYKKVFDNIKSQIEASLPGVTMNIETMPNQVFFAELRKYQTPAAMATWGGGTLDYYTFTQLFEAGAGYNYALYNNKTFDDKVMQARREIDPTKQAELFAEAESLLVEDAVFIPIYQLGQTYNLSPNIETLLIQPTLPAIQYKYVKKK